MASRLIRFFEFGHLPPHLSGISADCAELARRIDEGIPDAGPTAIAEKTAGLRKLLEAKDCFVRAALAAADPRDG